jgi:transposase
MIIEGPLPEGAIKFSPPLGVYASNVLISNESRPTCSKRSGRIIIFRKAQAFAGMIIPMSGRHKDVFRMTLKIHKFGHIGITRHIPDQIDEVIEETLQECPDCHHPLANSVEVIEHVQEDIIPAKVHVRKYRRHRYYCACCQKVVTAPYHPQHVPQGYLGANVLIQAAILKYYHCLPYDKIVELFRDMAGLKVSAGGLSQALARISRWMDMFTFLQDPKIGITTWLNG